MSAKFTWDDSKVKAGVHARVARGLHAAALVVANRAKVLLSVAGTGQGRDAKGKFRKSYGSNPSRPGDPPAKQTGRLRASVAVEVDGLVARVGTNVPYGRHLELGTSKMAARPWLRRALLETQARVRRLIAGGPGAS